MVVVAGASTGGRLEVLGSPAVLDEADGCVAVLDSAVVLIRSLPGTNGPVVLGRSDGPVLVVAGVQCTGLGISVVR